jgi:hypothetical protein
MLTPKYYFSGKDDSVKMIIDYWKSRCGMSEEIYRAEVLLTISSKKSLDDYDSGFLGYLLTYKNDVKANENGAKSNYAEDPSSEIAEYNTFTTTLAKELKSNQKDGSIEFLVCEFYANNFSPLLTALENNHLAGTTLQQAYGNFKKELRDSFSGHTGFIAEYWLPTHKAKILGNHPGVGFSFGFKFARFSVDMTCVGRFLKSKNTYSTFFHDSLYTTKRYSGSYVGLDLEHLLVQGNQSGISLLGGIARDAITLIKEDKKTGQERVDIASLNLNLGLGYRYYNTTFKRYVGIQARFNLLDYNTNGGTNLSGNAVSVRLTFGLTRNFYRDHYSKLLKT